MSDYISRETLPEKRERGFIPDDDFNAGWNACLTAIASIPAADVAEVVRCGECAWWQDRWAVRTELGEWHYCANVDISTPKDFYCAFGEKRQESEFVKDIIVLDKNESEGEE